MAAAMQLSANQHTAEATLLPRKLVALDIHSLVSQSGFTGVGTYLIALTAGIGGVCLASSGVYTFARGIPSDKNCFGDSLFKIENVPRKGKWK